MNKFTKKLAKGVENTNKYPLPTILYSDEQKIEKIVHSTEKKMKKLTRIAGKTETKIYIEKFLDALLR